MAMVSVTRQRGLRLLVLALAAAWIPFRISAVETDNFYLPADKAFADFGDYLELMHTRAIEAGVRKVNQGIERALNLKDPAARAEKLEECHSRETLTQAVSSQFGEAPLEKSKIESALGGAWARDTFPEQTVRHQDLLLNLRGRMIIDPRALIMIVQSSTMKADGVYFGTDKLVHFHQLGRQYYHRYSTLLHKGFEPEEAQQKTIDYFANKAVHAEGRGFGTILTGIYSNGDMVANYVGFKFLLNLTEPVMLEGSEREPLVVRCGVFWRVNDHVRLHSGWFSLFISDHWNEALNPNLYDRTMRPSIQKILENRADRIVEFYTANDGRPDDPDYYKQLTIELSTYYGEPYGHSGHFDKLMNIGNTCFPALEAAVDEHKSQSAAP